MNATTKTAAAASTTNFHILTVDKATNTLKYVREFDRANFDEDQAMKYVEIRTRRRKIAADSVKHILRPALANGEPNLHGVKQPV
jgi:ribosomal protein L22